MSPEDAAAVAEAWTKLAPRNRYAQTFLALVSGTADVDEVPAVITGITRSLPGQWQDLAEIIVATAEALTARQAETDEAFDNLVEAIRPGVDVLELLADDVAEDLGDD